MSNELREERNQLAQLDYRDWLSKTIEELNGEAGSQIFLVKQNPNNGKVRLIVDLTSFATHMAKMKTIKPPLDEKTYRSTINMRDECRKVFGDQIKEIKTVLSRKLQEAIEQTSAGSSVNHPTTIEGLIDSMLVPLDALSKEASLFAWEFPQNFNLSSQELSLESSSKTTKTPTVTSHKVTIEISNANKFRESVLTALENNIKFLTKKSNDLEEDEKEFVYQNISANLESIKSDGSEELSRLETLINQETMGRLKREAEIAYLEYWANKIGEDCDRAFESGQESKYIHQFSIPGETDPRGITMDTASFYLKDYSRQIRELEKFINDPKKAPSDYDITYQGVTVNLQELFSRRDAFSSLPLIGQIKGCIGETDDTQNSLTSITLGLNFKLNGPVKNPVSRKSSFDYGLDLINPNSDLHKKGLEETNQKDRKKHIEKILKFFILYYFAFACLDNDFKNKGFDIGKFTQDFLAVFRDPSHEGDDLKQKFMQKFITEIDSNLMQHKLTAMVLTLKEYLKNDTFEVVDEKQLNIGVSKSLLRQELCDISDTGKFFGEDLFSDNLKECLKYVFISEPGASKRAMLQFPVKLKFETDNFYRQGKPRQFDMRYQIQDIHLLPIFYKFVMKDEQKQLQREKKNLKQLAEKLGKKGKFSPENIEEASELMSDLVFPGSVVEFQVREIPLEKATDRGTFIYELTFRTLGFMILEILTSPVKFKKKLFVGQWILHESSKDKTTEQETAIHQITKEWSHIFNDGKLLMNSQGLDLSQTNPYKITNAKSSLYSVLPQEYRNKIPEQRTLDRLLIVMVSSNKCDARSSRWGDNYIANLTGEIVAVEATSTGIQVSLVKKLAGNYWQDDLHRCPQILRDSIYPMSQKGFRHVLYIAKTPFSENLHLTDQKNELFFMSPEIVKYLKEDKEDKEDAENLIIYPVLYDSYNALLIDEGQKEETLYVQDMRQLRNLFDDPNRSQVVFFNLFTGKAVDKSKTFYNTMTTYSTLLKAHPGDVLDETEVVKGLIKPGQLKNDIMLYLTLLHYSKYEKNPTKRERSLKQDPLNDIIGDGKKAIGRVSAKSRHCIASVQMNYLAFLTDVYDALPRSTSELDRIEDYINQNKIAEPSEELPKDYIDFLVKNYQDPLLKPRIHALLESQDWTIENGMVYLKI